MTEVSTLTTHPKFAIIFVEGVVSVTCEGFHFETGKRLDSSCHTAGTHNVSGRPENIDIYPSLNDGAYQDPSLLHSSSLFG